jgi:soluble lytic murein transglycosylase-like protein
VLSNFSKLQALRLNKIEIGQFLNMKYKLGIPNKMVDMTTVPKWSDTLNLSHSSPVITTLAIMNIIISPKSGTLFSAIKSPSLFKKILSFTKVVFEKCLTNSGTPIIIAQKKKEIQYEKEFCCFSIAANIIDIEKPKLIPNQNTKFQNLSFVSHLDLVLGRLFVATSGFVKSCITRSYIWFKPYTSIIAKIEVIAKGFIAISSIIGLCLLHNSAYGVVNSNEAMSRHKIIELIKIQETKHHIPSGLLLAVIKTESNLNPLALNINGKSLFFNDKDKAIKAINEAIASGVTNLDIGLAQINYRWHGENFTSVDSMLSPELNINYAAELLSKLKLTHGDWHKALRYYHSAKPIHHKAYSRKVVMCWLGM